MSDLSKEEPAPLSPTLARQAALIAALTALLAAVVAVAQLGRIHPDEVFQYLEPANSRAFGFGVLAWEWQVGLRNWAVPGLFTWMLRAAAALGIEDAQARRAWLEIPQAALHFAMVLAVWRLTVRRVPGRWSLGAPLLIGLYWPVVQFGGRTLGESISTALLVIALERVDAAKKGPWHVPALGGLLLGAAVIVRYPSAVMVLAALGWLIGCRAWRPLLFTVLGGLVAIVALGLIDAATWGVPFHSFRQYVEFNVFSGQAAVNFGSEPWWFFFPVLGWMSIWVWPALVLGLRRRDVGVGLFAVAGLSYLVAICFTAHKEARFLYPTLVLWLVAAIPPWLALIGRAERRLAGRLVLGASLLSGLATLALQSPYQPDRPEEFRLVVKAGRSATGLVLLNEGVWGSPGFFYLGRNIPWVPCDVPEDAFFRAAMASAVFNRAVTWDDRGCEELKAAGFRLLERHGGGSLYGR